MSEEKSPEKRDVSPGFLERFMQRNETDRKMVVIKHSKKRDSMCERYLVGLEGNTRLDNPLVSFDTKDKLGERKAAKECLR